MLVSYYWTVLYMMLLLPSNRNKNIYAGLKSVLNWRIPGNCVSVNDHFQMLLLFYDMFVLAAILLVFWYVIQGLDPEPIAYRLSKSGQYILMSSRIILLNFDFGSFQKMQIFHSKLGNVFVSLSRSWLPLTLNITGVCRFKLNSAEATACWVQYTGPLG